MSRARRFGGITEDVYGYCPGTQDTPFPPSRRCVLKSSASLLCFSFVIVHDYTQVQRPACDLVLQRA